MAQRILTCKQAARHLTICNSLVAMTQATSAEEVIPPIIEPLSLYPDRDAC